MLGRTRFYLRNLFGWKTSRHIVVIESDDWGSVRTRSLKDRIEMEALGLDHHSSVFPKYDCLESNADLERLYEVLSRHGDSTGRPAVITPMCVVSNPDFIKIEQSGFTQYFNEPFPVTCEKYPNHDRVLSLWKEGCKKRLFVPALHAREHLNVSRWMRNLQSPNGPMRIAFQHGSTGVMRFNGKEIPEFLGAFYSQDESEYTSILQIVADACDQFTQICGYKPTHFIAPNEEPIDDIFPVLVNKGVKYATNAKLRRYPVGNGKFGKEFVWLGKQSKHGYINIVRNGHFEQCNPGIDWVDMCMSEIQMAFKFHMPCVISSHRVHYIGGIEESNASLGLKKLDELLTKIEKQWPDVEYMTSTELGEVIRKEKKLD